MFEIAYKIKEEVETFVASNNWKRDISQILVSHGRTGTVRHLTQVMAEVEKLIPHFPDEADSARKAAWAHDIGLIVPSTAMLSLAELLNIEPLIEEIQNPVILHGKIGAEMVRRMFKWDNDGVLNAIRFHTTLRSQASPLEKMVFLADKIAVDQIPINPDYISEINVTDSISLDAGCLAYLTFITKNNRRLGWILHPNALAAYNELTERAKGPSSHYGGTGEV